MIGMYDNMNMIGQMNMNQVGYDYQNNMQDFSMMNQGFGQSMPTFNNLGIMMLRRDEKMMYLKSYIMRNTGLEVEVEQKIDEVPQFLRHACPVCGVVKLPMYSFCIQEAQFSIQFYFCNHCRKLYYPADMMK